MSLFSSFSEKEWVASVALILALVLAWLLLSGIRDVHKNGGRLTQRGFSGVLQVSKAAFVREVLRWCVAHFGLPPRCRTWPRLDLRYYKHRKVMGTYQQRGKVITVYWGSHADLREVVNTVIHEYQHFLDIRSGKDDRAYDKEIKEVGYQNNRYEKKARELADRWQKVCLNELEKRGLVGWGMLD